MFLLFPFWMNDGLIQTHSQMSRGNLPREDQLHIRNGPEDVYVSQAVIVFDQTETPISGVYRSN